MHQCAPPFVPRVRENQSITKYFEEEKDILTDESTSFASRDGEIGEEAALNEEELHAALGPTHLARWKAERKLKEKRELGLETCADSEIERIKEHFGPVEYEKWRCNRIVEVQEQRGEAGMAFDGHLTQSTRKKVKKRPRDKMLRDPAVGRKVMELRKRNAFFGYTYRRPKSVVLDEFEGKRRGLARPSILPLDKED